MTNSQQLEDTLVTASFIFMQKLLSLYKIHCS